MAYNGFRRITDIKNSMTILTVFYYKSSSSRPANRKTLIIKHDYTHNKIKLVNLRYINNGISKH